MGIMSGEKFPRYQNKNQDFFWPAKIYKNMKTFLFPRFDKENP